MYLLDTNTAIALMKKDPQAVARLAQTSPNEVCISTISQAELFFGMRNSGFVEANLARLNIFLQNFQSVDFDRRAAEEYGLIRFALKIQGTPIGPNDLLIAAITRAHDFTLVTHNVREFARVPGLRYLDWMPG